MSIGEQAGVAGPDGAHAGVSELIGELRHPRTARFVIVGVSVYAFEIAVIVGAQRAGMGTVAAVGLSYWLALLLSFTFQKLFTFRDTRTHRRVLLPQITAFAALVLFNFGFTILMTRLLQHDLPAVVVRTLAIGITMVWNFYLYRTRLFKTPIDG